MKTIVLSVSLVVFTVSLTFPQDCYPVVDIEHGYLLSSKHCDYSSPAFSLTGEENFKLYSLSGYIGMGVGAVPETFEGPCEEQLYVTVSLPESEFQPVIGICADYDPFPKTLKVQSVESETYKKITADVLIKEGLSNPDVQIKNLIRTDLEGDGVEEVIICASYYESDDVHTVSEGDYAILFYRKLIHGKVHNIILSEYIYTAIDASTMKFFIELKAILDVNGDGKMEIIINEGYYEGNGTVVFEIDSEEYSIFLTAGCGA